MTRSKKRPAQAYSSPAWMTIFGDMNTLLLTFFVMMIASMSPNSHTNDIQIIKSTLKGNVGFLEGGNTVTPGQLGDAGQMMENLPAPAVENAPTEDLKAIVDQIKADVDIKKAQVQQQSQGFTITISSDVLFRPGSAEIGYEEGRDMLRNIGMSLKKLAIDYRIEVVGHTDNNPLPPGSNLARRFPTNLELSAARACTIVRYFADFGIDSGSLFAEGRGDYEPADPTDTAEGRAFNRRIEIRVSPK